MTLFVSRNVELSLLRKRLDQVSRTGAGIAVAVRGRRQVGKSRLFQEFCDRAGLPYLFFTAVPRLGAGRTSYAGWPVLFPPVRAWW